MSEEKTADGTLNQGKGQIGRDVAANIVNESIGSATNSAAQKLKLGELGELEKGNDGNPIDSARSDYDSDDDSPRSDDSNPYESAAETRIINNADIHCEGVVIGPNGFVSIKSIRSINDMDTNKMIFNKDDNGDPTNTPLTLDTLKKQLNITVDNPAKNEGGSKRSRKARRTKKGGKKRRNTQRRHRKSR